MQKTDISSPTDKLRAWIEGGVGWIVFNNPEKHNAMSLEMWEGLAEVLEQLQNQDPLRVVILKGAGDKAFVSGADISEFESKRASQSQRDSYEAAFDRAQNTLAGFEKPVIAMVRGYCVGGGLALALNCDIRIASEESLFGIPAARLGVGYGFQSIKTLVAIVGPSSAKDILFSARFLKSDEALRLGLVNAVVEGKLLEESVREYADRLVNNAPLTIRSVKAAVGAIINDPGQTSHETVDALVKACFSSADYQEGRRAFMEKRKPRFSGS